MSGLKFKRGDTFDFAGPASLYVDGVLDITPDFSGVTLAAWVKKDDGKGAPVAGVPLAELVCAWLDIDAGIFSVSTTKEVTAAWPICKALVDIEFTWASGRRITTPVMLFQVVERSTHGA